MQIQGQRILVTGASSGIGRSLAIELGRRQAHLALAARRIELLNSTADAVEQLGNRPQVIECDLSVPGSAAELAQRASERLGGIDILVNNAGGGVGGLEWAVGDSAEGRSAFELNVWSPLALIAQLVPAMKERGSGCVVNVTSLAQVSTWPFMGHYSATKAALGILTETLRMELSGSGVHVLEVIPGPVDTAMMGESRLVPGFSEATRRIRMGKHDQLARLMVSAIERERKRIVYPRFLRFPYALPGLVRALTPRQVSSLSAGLRLDDTRVLTAGSFGDEAPRKAREAWERGERDFTALQKETWG